MARLTEKEVIFQPKPLILNSKDQIEINGCEWQYGYLVAGTRLNFV